MTLVPYESRVVGGARFLFACAADSKEPQPLDPGARVSILDSLIASTLPITPRFVVGRVARRYIAGETVDAAVATVRALNAVGAEATVDVLGEYIHAFEEAEATAAEYGRFLDLIPRERLRCNVSIKLTAFGLALDRDRCLALVRSLAQKASEKAGFLRIDMENTPYTDLTLGIVRILRSEGLPVGVVLQAYLRRTRTDVAALVAEGVPVRFCKGIYRESPAVAFQDREEVRESYRTNLRSLLAGRAKIGIATHDEVLIADAEIAVRELSVPKDRYEFQMLLGVREKLRDDLLGKGHPVRIYVPFGRAWYGYSVRRLRENPAIAGHVFRAMLGLG
ncbi:MAG: proline dehydrogenase family protein [Planctomycetes bacterium]|nr:proline dehydrogenase family protein [Planctomycetota bacterium]